MVCQACERVLSRKAGVIFDFWSQYNSFVAHHKYVEDLRRAAEDEKCFICYDLWMELPPEARADAILQGPKLHDASRSPWEGHATVASLKKIVDPFEWQTSKYSFVASRLRHLIRHVIKENGPWRLQVTLSAPLKGLVGPVQGMKLYDLHSKKSTTSMSRINEIASETTAILETNQQVSQWLQQCCRSHRACNDDYDRGVWNPTRLLDVGFAAHDAIKLFDTATCRTAMTYVTLSHRWGKVAIPSLTRATESSFKKAIQLSDLPLTFQHAVSVVRALEHRYLWIDSLCIRQDDGQPDSDWIREASLMHKVYRHGHFNISATGAIDGSEGLFARRDHISNGFVDVAIMSEALSGGSTPCIAVDSSLWMDNVVSAPLNKRGWVVQERILSKRVLHFGKTQLFWECRELEAAESFPDGLWSIDGPRPAFKCLDRDLSSRILKQAKLPCRDQKFWAYDFWTAIAKIYSRCSLTKPGDKLVAIMGLAKHIKQLNQDMYVAGMWRRFLASELRWFSDVDPGPRTDMYIAPTWSWLSRNSPVACGAVSDQGLRLSVKAVELDLATDDEFGPVTGGRIYLEGVLRRINIHVKSHRDDFLRWELTLPDVAAFSAAGSILDVVYLDIQPKGFQAENENDMLFCMEILDDTEYWPTLEILLLRCEDRANGVFSRVGLCHAHDSRKKLLGDRKRVRELPCVSWNAEKKLHTICVI